MCPAENPECIKVYSKLHWFFSSLFIMLFWIWFYFIGFTSPVTGGKPSTVPDSYRRTLLLSRGGGGGGEIGQRQGDKSKQKTNLFKFWSHSSKMCPTIVLYHLWGSNLAPKQRVEPLRLLIERSQMRWWTKRGRGKSSLLCPRNSSLDKHWKIDAWNNEYCTILSFLSTQ